MITRLQRDPVVVADSFALPRLAMGGESHGPIAQVNDPHGECLGLAVLAVGSQRNELLISNRHTCSVTLTPLNHNRLGGDVQVDAQLAAQFSTLWRVTKPRLRLLSYMTPGFPVSLFERIAHVVDADLELVQTRSGPAPGEDPFADGSADLGWICSTSFVDLATRSRTPSVQLAGVAWVPLDPGSDGKPQYFGDIVVPADSPIHSFADLAGRSIGCNDYVSLSGHFAFRIAVHEFGADPDTYAQLRFTGGHHYSLDELVAGQLDAAVVDSVVRASRCQNDPQVADLRLIERLGPWPVQPLVARADLDADVVAAVRAALLESSTDPAMQAELRAASLSGFVAVEADHYLPIKSALDSVAIAG